MSKNRLALLRYKTIDQCLRKRYRKWTLQDLMDAVIHALHEFEGIPTISLRTIQLDIQYMRSEEGFHAPIVVVDKKYYTYADEQFRIDKPPLSIEDIEHMGIQDISLKVEARLVSHFIDMPFHASQTIDNQSDRVFLLKLKMVITADLEQRILSYGELLKVITPDVFRQRLVERIATMWQMYKK